MRKYMKLIIVSLLILGLVGCGKKQATDATTADNGEVVSAKETEEAKDDSANDNTDDSGEAETTNGEEDSESSGSGDITIVYTNDVHSYIDNVVTDSNGNVTGDGLRFSKIAAMVADLREAGGNVLLVDSGDELQGDIYGALDEGNTIIDIMNATGYQLATPGNHDFDYGVIEFLKQCERADYPYITCNFHSTKSKEIIFTDTKTFDIAGKKVAFVGITTPETITSSSPVYFQDENGEFIYTVEGVNDVNDLYISVQNAVDSVRDKADYVIALGHVGVGIDEQKGGFSSEDIIENVTGLDAFIDGHSHSTIEGQEVKSKDGKNVILTQTGCYLSAVGQMTIAEDGTITTKLVNDYDREDDKVAELEKAWIQDVQDKMGEQIATLDTTLYINNPEDANQRLIRSTEMNSGDFTADSIYWFFNENLGIDCDVAIQNAGGIRSQVEKGDITYLDAKQVEPFGNMICLIAATGQQIVDALEMGATMIGVWDDEWKAPAENGGFMQVAGLSYTIDASVESSVKTDGSGMFKSVDGEYRVKDVKVYNRETGNYEDIDLNKEYQLAGINYVLRNDGNGLNMFDDDKLTVDYVGQDYVILSQYILSFAKDGDYARINTKNSPLSSYNGYLLDYENPMGSGRINIVNVNYNAK